MKLISLNRTSFIMILKTISSLLMLMVKSSNIYLMRISLNSLQKMINLLLIKTHLISKKMKSYMIISMNNFLQKVPSIIIISYLLIMIILLIFISILTTSMLLSSKLRFLIRPIIYFYKPILQQTLLTRKICIFLFRNQIGICRNRV